ncbi:hypothetical protein M0813_10665 [Anaeramoeba flamelloides]|uniref:Uncharacterized protein n=1 Tax=Anaeramoeba flamelloides TaxID=1746091 RepID=A0ABQ8X2E0_9EUKA|nr:hypothetical protein M0813_10665 [Anaeramoeba flamelloides]
MSHTKPLTRIQLWEEWNSFKNSSNQKITLNLMREFNAELSKKYDSSYCEHILLKTMKFLSGQRKRKRNETFWNTDTKLKIVVKMGRKKKRKNFTMVNQKRKKRKNKVEQEILSTTLKSIKKGHGYTDINEYCKIDKNRYYRFLKKIGLKYDVYALDLLKKYFKIIQNTTITIGFDGRYSSRRGAKECTVSFIVLGGCSQLVGKVLLCISCKHEMCLKSKCKGTSGYEFLNPNSPKLKNKTKIKGKKNSSESREKITTEAKELFLKEIDDFMEKKAPFLLFLYTTNLNESFNALLANKIPKVKNFPKSYYLRSLYCWFSWNQEQQPIISIEDITKNNLKKFVSIEQPKNTTTKPRTYKKIK